MGDYHNTACFIARCQPFHSGHKEIIDTLLAEGKKVIVALYDTEPDERNPLSPFERQRIIHEVYSDRVQTCVIPAFGILVFGRGVGYTFREFADVGGSATEVRQARRVIWLTGQSGAGKTTLAYALRNRLRSVVLDGEEMEQAVILDGDDMRKSISVEAGYSLDERLKHARRIARLAQVLSEQQNVIVSSIGATACIRAAVDEIARPIWVYVKRMQPEREGYPYEPPDAPDLTVDNDILTPEEAVEYAWRGLLKILFAEGLDEASGGSHGL